MTIEEEEKRKKRLQEMQEAAKKASEKPLESTEKPEDLSIDENTNPLQQVEKIEPPVVVEEPKDLVPEEVVSEPIPELKIDETLEELPETQNIIEATPTINTPEDDIMTTESEVPVIDTDDTPPTIELGKPIEPEAPMDISDDLNVTLGMPKEEIEANSDAVVTPVIPATLEETVNQNQTTETMPETPTENVIDPTITPEVTPMPEVTEASPKSSADLPELPPMNTPVNQEVFVSSDEDKVVEAPRTPVVETAETPVTETPAAIEKEVNESKAVLDSSDYQPKMIQPKEVAASAPESEAKGKWVLDSRNENESKPVPAEESLNVSSETSEQNEKDILERAEKAMYDHESMVEVSKDDEIKESGKAVLDSNFHKQENKVENLDVVQNNNISMGGAASKGENSDSVTDSLKKETPNETNENTSPFVDYSWIILLAFIIGMILLLILVPSFREELIKLFEKLFDSIKNAV